MLIDRIESMKPVNLFLGAGISKLAPAYAPIWREIQIGLCEALFEKMILENWDIENAEAEIEELRRFNFRPETFWELILSQTSLAFVSDALRIVNRGQPNLNHKVIAELCHQGIVNCIVTTNFDEYLDRCLPNKIRRITSQDGCTSVDPRRIYFKIHGTISSSESLQFTLQHTKKLPDWKSALLERCLKGYPLVIIGYSGWDDDIMPRLLEIAPQIPKIIVVRYPGVGKDEPVNMLMRFNQTEIIEADFSKETQKWVDLHKNSVKIKLNNKFLKSEATGAKEFYDRVLTKLNIPVVPFLVSMLFELAANKDLSKKYAWFADDACDDRRYKDHVPDDLRHRVKAKLSKAVASKDAELSRTFMRESNKDYPDNAAQFIENFDRMFEYFQEGELTQSQEQEIELGAGGALTMQNLGIVYSSYITFRAAWIMGRLRLSQERLSESYGFFTQAIKDLPDDLFDEQKCNFFLDLGLAAYKHCLSEESEEILSIAMAALEKAEQIALNINDHVTAAKAKMNLSWAYVLCKEFDKAIQEFKQAQELALLSGDYGLQQRSMDLEVQVRKKIAQLQR